MSAAAIRSKFPARNQLQQWGVFSLMALLLIGIVIFIFLVLLRDLRRRTEYNSLLASAQTELRMAQRVRAETPAKLQNQLVEAQEQLDMAAQAFLNEAESTIVVNRLYTYAEAAGVEIVNLQAAPALVAATHSQRDYHFQVAGQIEALMTFLGSIEEVQLPGFVIGNVAILPDPASPASLPEGKERHLLTMDASALSSPYSTRTVLGPEQNPAVFANVGALPLAEVQRQVEVAWVNRDWKEAVTLLKQVVATSPENEAARIALYRAHINDGYRYLTERAYAAAQAEFETALTIHPDGREATSELQQLAADNTLSHQVEDQLRQALAQAKASENWQEAIRLLRIIAAVDPAYGPVNDELNQAYINYGNQLARAGESSLAQEQYQLAQYTPPDQAQPNQPQAGGEVVIAIAQPMTVAEVIPVALAPEATPTPSPMPTVAPTHTPTHIPTQPPAPTQTATPLPTASPVPTNTPMPTATYTPMPTATFTPPPPTATSTVTQAAVATSLPAATLVNSAAPAPAATATVATPASIAVQPTATYVVRQGDTLFSIAQRFGTTVEALQAANGLTSNTIVVGQLLVITSPAPQPVSAAYVEHTVGPNDTLYSLAQSYGTSIEAIMQANGLSGSNIYIGQRLLIPAPVSSISAVTPAG